MKIPSPCLHLLLGLASGFSLAGVESPTANPPSYITGSVSVGYDTSYLFRGANFGDDAPWAGADFYVPLGNRASLNMGTWYVNPTSNNSRVSDELDFYSHVLLPVGDCEVSVGGTWYYFAEDETDSSELSMSISCPIDESTQFTFEYVYNLRVDGTFFGYYLDRDLFVTDLFEVVLTAGLSHASERYNRRAFGGDHVFVQTGVTYHFADHVDMNAYVLGNFPYNDLNALGEQDDVHGGISMTIRF